MREAGGGGGVWNADTLISEGQSETSQDRQIAGTDDLKKKKERKTRGRQEGCRKGTKQQKRQSEIKGESKKKTKKNKGEE